MALAGVVGEERARDGAERRALDPSPADNATILMILINGLIAGPAVSRFIRYSPAGGKKRGILTWGGSPGGASGTETL